MVISHYFNVSFAVKTHSGNNFSDNNEPLNAFVEKHISFFPDQLLSLLKRIEVRYLNRASS